jgi:hypothetical protein
MDIQIKSKDSMYPLDETHWLSDIYTYINQNNQLKEFNFLIELKWTYIQIIQTKYENTKSN